MTKLMLLFFALHDTTDGAHNGVAEKPKVKGKGKPGPISKYTRGQANVTKNVKDKKLKGYLKRNEKDARAAAAKAAKWEILLPEQQGFLEAEGMEKTYQFTQKAIVKEVDLQTQTKQFNLTLENAAPYKVDYDRTGRYLLIGGRKGHVATFDWRIGSLGFEINLNETVRDVQWLHNETMMAVAQKKYVYIYDRTGAEMHCLRNHIEAERLTYLPYHFLLASVGKAGYLKYQDTSTGKLISEHRTKLGACNVLTQNSYNAVVLTGHHNGTVEMWTPNMSTPVVKMLCHKGPVSAVAVDRLGRYVTTAGLDGQMKVWDVRTYKHIHSYFTHTPANSLHISQSGLLGVGFGSHVQVWKDAFQTKQAVPYMQHELKGPVVDDITFVPYEDVLGVGHSKGISSLLVPGAGDANFDALEINPYANKKQRQEGEVRSLLEKIPSKLITLDPNSVGRMDRGTVETIALERKKQFEANNPTKKFEPKHKMRGKSSSQRRVLRKQLNVIDERKTQLRERLEKEKQERKRKREGHTGPAPEETRSPLDRFN
ncbi:hypothetical protein SARC_11796 [Sphaeroforma arctica JP610]|uniref:BING4 C-terminal domain-containing protein n=1 Tax=Sphaeroforma arctica JP610 TaxID=667725 RepID=A0A0L0FG10_9EUKA|nr:hypothetical protein SARC_11796 [Sphaeroforma arctica JP610]KNC75685.1 hypothetical protein SARC_11796 [Sphaeroforma arctica JP610]|eukprot:XP_014149587.1 hypothetical protein SARC_11796 [Sphaeroforma arctica JP610]